MPDGSTLGMPGVGGVEGVVCPHLPDTEACIIAHPEGLACGGPALLTAETRRQGSDPYKVRACE